MKNGYRLKDLTGLKFNKLFVVKRAGSQRDGKSTWECLCDCGRSLVISSDHLTRKTSPVKSCGCERYKKGSKHKQWIGFEGISGGWWYAHVLRERTQTIRQRVPVTVTIQYAWELFISQNKKCYLSGIDIVIAGSSKYNTASIDRIDSSKGYEEGNIQWVHKDLNFMKRNYSQEYFIEVCKKVAENFEDVLE
jgi:hypothetical protein